MSGYLKLYIMSKNFVNSQRPPVSVEPVPLVESDDSGTEQPDLPLESATDEDAAEASVGAETTDALLNIYASLECCSLARNDPQMLDALMSANPTSSPCEFSRSTIP